MKKLFDVYHDWSCDRWEGWWRLQMRNNPDHPTVVAYRKGAGPASVSWAAFEARSAYEDEHKPYWRKLERRLIYQPHWWLEDHGPRAQYHNVRAFCQRGRRGWADEDAWNLDDYFARWLPGALRYLADTTSQGVPSSYLEANTMMTDNLWSPEDAAFKDASDRWTKELRSAAIGLESYFNDHADYEQAKLAMIWVAEHFGSLWD
jgi:hypothetical protein